MEVLLHVGFARWPIERCLEDEKSKLGLSHFEVRHYPNPTSASARQKAQVGIRRVNRLGSNRDCFTESLDGFCPQRNATGDLRLRPREVGPARIKVDSRFRERSDVGVSESGVASQQNQRFDLNVGGIDNPEKLLGFKHYHASVIAGSPQGLCIGTVE